MSARTVRSADLGHPTFQIADFSIAFAQKTVNSGKRSKIPHAWHFVGQILNQQDSSFSRRKFALKFQRIHARKAASRRTGA